MTNITLCYLPVLSFSHSNLVSPSTSRLLSWNIQNTCSVTIRIPLLMRRNMRGQNSFSYPFLLILQINHLRWTLFWVSCDLTLNVTVISYFLQRFLRYPSYPAQIRITLVLFVCFQFTGRSNELSKEGAPDVSAAGSSSPLPQRVSPPTAYTALPSNSL